MQIAWLPPAIIDLQRLRSFIAEQNPPAAQRAVTIIKEAIALLDANPFVGKTPEDLPDYRDIVIPFGAAGYVLRYRIHCDTIYIVALKHAKEAGFNKIERASILTAGKQSSIPGPRSSVLALPLPRSRLEPHR